MTDRTFLLQFPSSRDRGFAIDQERQPFPDITRLVEMSGHALRAPTENATPSKSDMMANTLSSVTSSPMKIGRRPLNGSWLISSVTPDALLNPECLIS